jgi:hypothetical protein
MKLTMTVSTYESQITSGKKERMAKYTTSLAYIPWTLMEV